MDLIKSYKFLFILLSLDLIFIILSFFHYFSDLIFSDFLVSLEGSYAEKFQYLKFTGISTICFLFALKRKSLMFLIFMIIPIYLLWDDAGRLHEQFGSKIALIFHKGNRLDILFFNFRYQDVGEISYLILMSFALLMVFLICYKLSNVYEKSFLKYVFKLLIIFGFFAVFVDLVHQFSWGKTYILLGIFEDGGEMVIVSFISALFFKNLKEIKKSKFIKI